MQLVMFSKMLKNVGNLSVDKAGDYIAEMGFDGVDLTVRPDGHVLPEEVTKRLPEAVETLKSKSLTVPMITSNVTAANEPYAEEIFKTASECGVKYIKLGYWLYEGFGKIREQIEKVHNDALKGIYKLGMKYNVTAGIHMHSGDCLSGNAAVLSMLLEGYDPDYLCAYIDPGHMIVEGGLSGWKIGMDLLQKHIRMVAVKDVGWFNDIYLPPAALGKKRWRVRRVPLTEGMVPWQEVFEYLSRIGFDGPVSVHSEYDEKFFNLENLVRQTKEDLAYLKNILQKTKKA